MRVEPAEDDDRLEDVSGTGPHPPRANEHEAIFSLSLWISQSQATETYIVHHSSWSFYH